MFAQEDSCPEYMRKAEDCLKTEEERVEGYLHIDSKPKLLAEVEKEVLAKYEAQLLEKENSGCAALLRDDKVSNHLIPLLILGRHAHPMHGSSKDNHVITGWCASIDAFKV